MKQITSNTVLIQEDKSYPAIQTEQGIVWVDPSLPIEEKYPKTVVEKLTTGNYMLWQIDNINDIDRSCQYQIVATTFELEGVPKIELEDEIEKLAKEYSKNEEDYTLKLIAKYSFKDGYKANQAKYTKEDMKKAYSKGALYGDSDNTYYFDNLLQSLNSIKEITVDENFCILNIVN